MIRLLFGILFALSLSIPASASEIQAPEVPESAMDIMPENTDSFGNALVELLRKGILLIQPELDGALRTCSGILICALLYSILPILSEKLTEPMAMAWSVALGTVMLQRTGTMIGYAADALRQICDYGKLLCPVLTTALAAQGGITASAALYTGTIAFITLLSILVSRLLIPLVYIFLLFSVAGSAIGEGFFRNLADGVKHLLTWLLKTLLIVFTTYMSVTGVVSGTTDAAALKTAKVTLSSVVPVVGGILSDASESVLVSMGILKNAAGIYGILAVLALFMGPFVKVGVQYLLLKGSAALCSLFGDKRISSLVGDFSTAMGLLVAMVAAGCVLILISTVCYLKGIS